jgi:hypothetical protein
VIGEPANSSFDRIVPEASVSTSFSTLEERQGQVVVTENPQNQSQPLMLVGGSDMFGLWASVNALDGTDSQTTNITATYEGVSQEELDSLESSDSTGGQLLLQVDAKHTYITEGNTTMGGYINDLEMSELLFQRVTVYTTSQFDRSEMTAFRTQGVQISQKNWIQGDNSGSYVATVPIDELSRFVENPRVTRIETRENVFTTSRGVEPVKPS